MSASNPPTAKTKLRLTPEQASAWLIIEHCISCLQSGMNQTGSFLGLTDAGDAIGEAQMLLAQKKEELLLKWDRRVQLAGDAKHVRLGEPH